MVAAKVSSPAQETEDLPRFACGTHPVPHRRKCTGSRKSPLLGVAAEAQLAVGSPKPDSVKPGLLRAFKAHPEPTAADGRMYNAPNLGSRAAHRADPAWESAADRSVQQSSLQRSKQLSELYQPGRVSRAKDIRGQPPRLQVACDSTARCCLHTRSLAKPRGLVAQAAAGNCGKPSVLRFAPCPDKTCSTTRPRATKQMRQERKQKL